MVWAETLALLVAMLPFVALAGAVLYAGYMSYKTQQLKAERAAAPPPGPDPIIELSRLDVEITESLSRARVTLEQTRETLQRGLRG